MHNWKHVQNNMWFVIIIRVSTQTMPILPLKSGSTLDRQKQKISSRIFTPVVLIETVLPPTWITDTASIAIIGVDCRWANFCCIRQLHTVSTRGQTKRCAQVQASSSIASYQYCVQFALYLWFGDVVVYAMLTFWFCGGRENAVGVGYCVTHIIQ